MPYKNLRCSQRYCCWDWWYCCRLLSSRDNACEIPATNVSVSSRRSKDDEGLLRELNVQQDPIWRKTWMIEFAERERRETHSKHRRMKSMKLLSVVRRIWARGRLAGRRFFNVLVVTVRGIPLESRRKQSPLLPSTRRTPTNQKIIFVEFLVRGHDSGADQSLP